MLMPILTVKTAVAAAQAAAAVESIMPKERTAVASSRISGNQSDTVLKILETLNRHLVGNAPLPKEALVRLLDTLAKLLKFPPLPQESLRDFSKRLAVFLETLPPAARLALEKQIGQQNLATSLRILADVLKNPAMINAPRLLERFFPQTGSTNPATKPPAEQRPAQASPPRDQLPVLIRQALIPAGPFLSIPTNTIPDPGLLQAALKKAFGDQEDGATAPAVSEDGDGNPVTGPRKDDASTRTPAARNAGNTAMIAQNQTSAKATPDGIPLLRAAVAFLASDPTALSQVAAIASGDIGGQMKAEIEQELGLELPEMSDVQGFSIESEGTPHSDSLPLHSTEASEAHLRTSGNTAAPLSVHEASEDAWLIPANTGEPPSSAQTETALPIRTSLKEVEGFTGHDLGEWQLETEALPLTGESEADAAGIEQPEKNLADTLKALVEASLPPPEGASDGISDALFSALAGDAADMGAQALFAELEAADGAFPDGALTDGTLADPALLTGDIGEKAEHAMLEEDGWAILADSSQDRATSRQAFAHPTAIDEFVRDAQLPAQPQAGIVRDGIPFAMIPYLPAQTHGSPSGKIEDEEQPGFAGEEEQSGRDETGDQNGKDEHEPSAVAETTDEAEDDGSNADTAYDLYRRMGGLG